MIRQYRIFIASSFQHETEREILANAFREDNDEVLQFFPYLQDKNGDWVLVPGKDSQEQINNKSLTCNAFILYVRDNIGAKTIEEFNKQLYHGDITNHFIFVLHHPGASIELSGNNNPVSWEEFYQKHMVSQKTPGNSETTATYYEIQVNSTGDDEKDLREKIARIKKEISRKQLIALRPADMDYRRLLSQVQEEYRLDFDYYFRRSVDDKLKEIVLSGETPFTIVTGMSLAGKTRAVVKALSEADDNTTRIFFMRGCDESASEEFLRIDPDSLFIPGKRNILVIDDIDQLVLSGDRLGVASPKITNKLLSLVVSARSNPGRLSIIATSCLPADDLLHPVRRYLPNPGAFESPEEVLVSTMKLSEMHEVTRTLRGRGLLSPAQAAPISGSMPLGVLFVNLSGLRAKYEDFISDRWSGSDPMTTGADNKTMFDAIKTISIWKRASRFDFDLLFDFIAKAVDQEWFADKRKLYRFLLDLSPLVNVRAVSRRSYSYSVEDIILNDVFRFEEQKGDVASANDLVRAGERIIGYVKNNHPDTKFEELAKLCTRLRMLPNGMEASDRLIDMILQMWPIDTIIDSHEEVETSSHDKKDWVDEWLFNVAEKFLREGKPDRVEELYNNRKGEHLLAALLRGERLGDREPAVRWKSKLLHDGGTLKPEFATTTNRLLLEEIALCLPVEAALEWFAGYDFDTAARRWTLSEYVDDEWEIYSRRFAAMIFNDILLNVTSYEQLTRALDTLSEVNGSRLSRGVSPFYVTEAEAYLLFIKPDRWQTIAQTVQSARVIEIFDRIIAVKPRLSSGRDAAIPESKLAMVLNSLLSPMSEPDAMSCWEKMDDLRDSYTLRMLVKKQPDYASAKGLVDSFLQTDNGRLIKAGNHILNALLDKVTISSDLYDCEESFIRYGLLKRGESLMALNDCYVAGILYNREFLTYDTVCAIARKHLDMGMERPVRTTSPLVSKTPDYFTARNLLYTFDEGKVGHNDRCAFLKSGELADLRANPLVVSWIFSKVDNATEGEDARRFLKALIGHWRESGQLDDCFGNQDGQVLAQSIKNRHIFPGYNDILDFFSWLKENGVHYADTSYLRRGMAARFIESDEFGHEEKIAELNRLVAWMADKPRKEVGRAVDMRLCIGKPDIWSRIDLKSVQPYPMVADDGRTWEIRQVSGLDFFLNNLRHRFVSPKSMCRVLFNVAGMLDGKTPLPDGMSDARPLVEELISSGVENKVFINGKSYTHLRDRFLKHGLDIEPLCIEYSLIAELCWAIMQGRISAGEAENKIKEYERRRNVVIHRTQAYYDVVVSSNITLPMDELLEYIKGLPKGISFSERMFNGVIRGVRNLSDLKKLETAYPGTIKQGMYVGLLLAINGIKNVIDPATGKDNYTPVATRADREEILAYVLRYDPAANTVNPSRQRLGDTEIAAMLSMFDTMSYRDRLNYIVEKDLQMRESTVFKFLRPGMTGEDFLMLEPFIPGGKLTTNLLNGILNRIYDFRSGRFNRNLFDCFNYNDVIDQWSDVINMTNDEFGEKVRGKLGSLVAHFSDSYDPDMRDLADFAYDILHNHSHY